MRTIKYQAWIGHTMIQVTQMDFTKDSSKEYNGYIEGYFLTGEQRGEHTSYPTKSTILREFTGLKDKNGKEIYEGDVVRIRKPNRHEQTHEGDNIPLGFYTEMLEPYIEEFNTEVKFANGYFGISEDDEETYPLDWYIRESLMEDYELCEKFRGRILDWDEDLEYLLEEYSLSSETELINYLGVEVIGNIYENPELLEGKTPS